MATLYDKLGGQAAISAVVDQFYVYMMADPVVNYFFENTDMNKQRERQKQFITLVVGGPNKYEGVDMKKAHEKFKIGIKEFDATWNHLCESLHFFKVPEHLIAQVKEIFYSVKDDVITVKEEEKEKTLFEKLGGQAAITAVVDQFYVYMMADPVVNYFFANTDMDKQRKRQTQFITMAVGGPNNYEGEDMKKAHAKFKIGHKEFDATWDNLKKSLEHFKVPENLITEVKEVFYSVEGQVLTC